MRRVLLLTLLLGALGAGVAEGERILLSAREGRHLKNFWQLTFGGSNAEAYFSWDGKVLIFQSTRDRYACDQIFLMNVDGSDVHLVSTGRGRTTCSFFLPGGQRIIYASTHARDPACPPRPDRSQGYVWALHDYDIYIGNADGTSLKRLTDNPRYDAEGALSPDGRTIVFTSLRAGDLDIYTMDTAGGNVKRITFGGFNSFPFFSPDGRRLVFSSDRRAKGPREFNIFITDWAP